MEEGQSMYFAYGSNLSFEQMAMRCPESRFLGRARLHGYSFQINERGFANVIPAAAHGDRHSTFVDGLCFRLTTSDEQSLDRSEGVPTAYKKKTLQVEFFPAPPSLLARDVSEIINHGVDSRRDTAAATSSIPRRPGASYRPANNDQPRDHIRSRSLPPVVGEEGERSVMTQNDETRGPVNIRYAEPRAMSGITATALVYLSTKFVTPGDPWDEYVERMNRGLHNALGLGISENYVRESVRPWLRTGRGERAPRRRRVSSQRRNRRRSNEMTSSSQSGVIGQLRFPNQTFRGERRAGQEQTRGHRP